MAIFVSDTFTDTSGTALPSHTGETGATWTRHGSYAADIVVSDANRARGTGTAALNYASGTPASAEYDVEADLRCVSNLSFNGVCGRVATGADTTYIARFFNANGWQLLKLVAGVATTLGTDTTDGTTLTVGSTYALKLEIRNAAKKLFIGGAERLSSADNAITAAGQSGVRGSGGSNTTGYHLDNYVATDLSGGGVVIPVFMAQYRQRWG